MNGARDYHRIITEASNRKLGGLEWTKLGYKNHGGDAECFRKGNVLYVLSKHARGRTFFIYLIADDGELFQVYGIVDGNPGWTESYGWLHRGTWVKPILAYLRKLAQDIEAHKTTLEEWERRKQSESNRAIGEKVTKFNEMFREVSV